MCVLAACRHGIDVRHLWGMTELSPLGSVSGVKGALANKQQVAGAAEGGACLCIGAGVEVQVWMHQGARQRSIVALEGCNLQYVACVVAESACVCTHVRVFVYVDGCTFANVEWGKAG